MKNSSKRFMSTLAAGIKTSDAKKLFRGKDVKASKLINKYFHSVIAPGPGVCFGSKQSPYYDCEEWAIPAYNFNDLSNIEREFYNKINGL